MTTDTIVSKVWSFCHTLRDDGVWSGSPDSCITQNHVFRATLVSDSVVVPEFVSHWGNAFGQDFFHLTGKQTTNLASISKGVLGSLPVPVPPATEQRALLSLLDAQFEVIEQNEREIDAALKRSEALRQSILKKALPVNSFPRTRTTNRQVNSWNAFVPRGRKQKQ